MAEVTLHDLLPPYMSHAAWVDLGDAIEKLFSGNVTPWRAALTQIRSSYLGDRVSGALAEKIQSRDALPETAYDVLDIETERQRLNMLGCRLSTVIGSDTATLSRFTRNIGAYWYEKGKDTLLDFLAFCTNSNVLMETLWTTNYVTFTPTHGTPVWSGGTWYPTTHVNLKFTSDSFDADVSSFVRFFYDLANYNVVIHHVSVETLIRIESPFASTAVVYEREDVAGNFSVIGLPYASLFTGLTSSDANLRGIYLAYFEAEALGWPGTSTNAYPYNGGLRDQGSETWDVSPSAWSDWNTWDGPSIGSIAYQHTDIDLNSVITFTVSEEHYSQGSTAVQVSVSNDSATWSPWQALIEPMTGRYARVRWTVTGPDPVLMSAHAYFYAV